MFRDLIEKVYIVTMTCVFDAGLSFTDVVGVTRLQRKAFELIEKHDYMSIVKNELVKGTVVNEVKHTKSIDVEDDGKASYSETHYLMINCEDCNENIWVTYNLIEKGLA